MVPAGYRSNLIRESNLRQHSYEEDHVDEEEHRNPRRCRWKGSRNHTRSTLIRYRQIFPKSLNDTIAVRYIYDDGAFERLRWHETVVILKMESCRKTLASLPLQY